MRNIFVFVVITWHKYTIKLKLEKLTFIQSFPFLPHSTLSTNVFFYTNSILLPSMLARSLDLPIVLNWNWRKETCIYYPRRAWKKQQSSSHHSYFHFRCHVLLFWFQNENVLKFRGFVRPFMWRRVNEHAFAVMTFELRMWFFFWRWKVEGIFNVNGGLLLVFFFHIYSFIHSFFKICGALPLKFEIKYGDLFNLKHHVSSWMAYFKLFKVHSKFSD